MAASAAITLAVKAATDKRARPAIASVVVAVFLPFILMTFIILSALDGTSTHNFSAVDLSFHGGVLPAEVPEEYREYIEDIRNSFQNLDGLIAGVENLEDGQMDASRVKSYFYALYFGEEQPSRRAQKAFVECFLRYEERIREVEEEDESITEETGHFPDRPGGDLQQSEKPSGKDPDHGGPGQRPEDLHHGSLWPGGTWQLRSGGSHGGRELRGAVCGSHEVYRLPLCVGRLLPCNLL